MPTETVETLQELTLRLPADVVERIQQAAERGNKTPEEVVSEILRISLPIVRKDAKKYLRSFAETHKDTPDKELRERARAWFPESDQARLNELLSRNKEGTLTPGEEDELDALIEKADTLATEKAASAYLLAQRKTRSS